MVLSSHPLLFFRPCTFPYSTFWELCEPCIFVFQTKWVFPCYFLFDSCRDSHTVIMCNSTMDSARWFHNYVLYQLPPMKQGSSSLGARGDRAKYFKGPIKEIELLGCLKGFCFALILSQIQQLLADFWKKVFLKLNVIRTKQTTIFGNTYRHTNISFQISGSISTCLASNLFQPTGFSWVVSTPKRWTNS